MPAFDKWTRVWTGTTIALPWPKGSEESGGALRPDRVGAVQERDFLDRRRDGADGVPHDLFRRAQGQHGLLDGLRRRRRQARRAGPDPAGASRLGADGDGLDHAPLPRRHGAGRRLHHERPVRWRHAPARHLRLQAALSRGRAAGLRLHRLPPHRRRRPGRGIERLRFDRDLRRRPAHRADEALRGRQAQQDHHDVHREERAPAGPAVRRSARPARRLPYRREAVRRDRRALWAAADQGLPQARSSTMPSG